MKLENIEDVLFEYPMVKCLYETNKIQYPEYSSILEVIGGIDYTRPKISPTHKVVSIVENISVEKISRLQDIENLKKLIEIIEKALERLKPEERKVIELKYFRELQISVISKELDRSRSTIYVWLQNALLKLKKIRLYENYTEIRQKSDTFLTDTEENP